MSLREELVPFEAGQQLIRQLSFILKEYNSSLAEAGVHGMARGTRDQAGPAQHGPSSSSSGLKGTANWSVSFLVRF